LRRISELYDMHVYSTDGIFIGLVYDMIFDDVEGRVVALVVSLDEKGKEKRTIPYSSVRACGDIYIVSV